MSLKMLSPARLAVLLTALAWLAIPGPAAPAGEAVEIREYRGQPLASFDRDYDNSIKGPQRVDQEAYRLVIEGLVEKPASLTYAQATGLKKVERVVVMHCVEGWSERLLFEGIRLVDLFELVGPKPGASHASFEAVDGYSSALPLDFIRENDILLATKVNGLLLDEKRGFPFWLVAQDKLGYKWVKWVKRIELTDRPRPGYWEQRGFSDQAGVPPERRAEQGRAE